MQERNTFHSRKVLPTTPLFNKGIASKEAIINYQRELKVEDTAKGISDKAKDMLTSSRRKFLAKGFIGSALVFAGSARISRSTTFLAIENEETVRRTPTYIDEVPGYLYEGAKTTVEAAKQAPGYLDEVPRYISKVPGYTEEGIRTAGEVTKEQWQIIKQAEIDFKVDCTINDQEEDHYHFHIPYLSPDHRGENLCEYLARTRAERAQEVLELREGIKSDHLDEILEERKQDLKRDQNIGEFKKIGFGVGLIGLGSLVASRDQENNTITRNKLISKMIIGAEGGIVSVLLHSDYNPLKGLMSPDE